MKINDNMLSATEKAIFALRSLYRSRGYSQYKMSKFEEYDLYAENKNFLVSDSIITFTGMGGKLMALKPDVTLSIVKSTNDAEGTVNKVYYNENVYRAKGGDRDFGEIMQAGLECIGEIDDYSLSEVLMLAAQSLGMISEDFVLDISHLGIVAEAIDILGVTVSGRAQILSAIADKNLHSALAVCSEEGVEEEKTKLLRALITCYGEPEKVLSELDPLLSDGNGRAAAEELKRLFLMLGNSVPRDKIRIDFSVAGDMNYYSGIVMSGFIRGISKSVLSGGQYDNLLRKMGRRSGAVGFALYLDLLEELEVDREEYDVDALIIYDENTDICALRNAADRLSAQGMSVTAQKNIPEKMRYKQLMKITESGVEIIEGHA
ncbi:MAG: ATP phosphoribosyltransferase regulatory subunit [Clostridia bacterium]|nr:ATP phosphoribosyltransferase regulatory subunit [Clostridia bacterium]